MWNKLIKVFFLQKKILSIQFRNNGIVTMFSREKVYLSKFDASSLPNFYPKVAFASYEIPREKSWTNCSSNSALKRSDILRRAQRSKRDYNDIQNARERSKDLGDEDKTLIKERSPLWKIAAPCSADSSCGVCASTWLKSGKSGDNRGVIQIKDEDVIYGGLFDEIDDIYEKVAPKSCLSSFGQLTDTNDHPLWQRIHWNNSTSERGYSHRGTSEITLRNNQGLGKTADSPVLISNDAGPGSVVCFKEGLAHGHCSNSASGPVTATDEHSWISPSGSPCLSGYRSSNLTPHINDYDPQNNEKEGKLKDAATNRIQSRYSTQPYTVHSTASVGTRPYETTSYNYARNVSPSMHVDDLNPNNQAFNTLCYNSPFKPSTSRLYRSCTSPQSETIHTDIYYSVQAPSHEPNTQLGNQGHSSIKTPVHLHGGRSGLRNHTNSSITCNCYSSRKSDFENRANKSEYDSLRNDVEALIKSDSPLRKIAEPCHCETCNTQRASRENLDNDSNFKECRVNEELKECTDANRNVNGKYGISGKARAKHYPNVYHETITGLKERRSISKELSSPLCKTDFYSSTTSVWPQHSFNNRTLSEGSRFEDTRPRVNVDVPSKAVHNPANKADPTLYTGSLQHTNSLLDCTFEKMTRLPIQTP